MSVLQITVLISYARTDNIYSQAEPVRRYQRRVRSREDREHQADSAVLGRHQQQALGDRAQDFADKSNSGG